jgi:DNA-binding transcriptional ArsR family regulator
MRRTLVRRCRAQPKCRLTKTTLDLILSFDVSRNLDINDAAKTFATLGHPDRLAAFRLLMRVAAQGVRPIEIAEARGLKLNTLSHHLADFTSSGLVTVTRLGRTLFYAADLDKAVALIGYLALDVGRARPNVLAPLLPLQKRTALK